MSSNKIFSDLGRDAKPDDEVRPRRRKSNLLDKRDNRLGELASGAIESKQLRRVDPGTCKMWAGHNRRYDLLNEDRCRDLIDGIKAQGKQEFPAIVRKLTNDPDFEYEVVCGARRHFAVTWLRENNYPDFNYLIEVRDLTDEEAFRLSDVENRDKEDISDFERAKDYARALGQFYRTQKEMAGRLEVSEAWLSRYLDLAKLPDSITKSFASVTEINVKNGRELKPLLGDVRKVSKIEARATELEYEQKRLASEGKPALSSAQVVAELKRAVVGKRKPTQVKPEVVTAPSGKTIAKIQKGRGSVLKLDLHLGNASAKDLIALVKKAIDEAKL